MVLLTHRHPTGGRSGSSRLPSKQWSKRALATALVPSITSAVHLLERLPISCTVIEISGSGRKMMQVKQIVQKKAWNVISRKAVITSNGLVEAGDYKGY